MYKKQRSAKPYAKIKIIYYPQSQFYFSNRIGITRRHEALKELSLTDSMSNFLFSTAFFVPSDLALSRIRASRQAALMPFSTFNLGGGSEGI
jgi:hypothetical protein